MKAFPFPLLGTVCALAGGVHGYFIEVSCLFTHLNLRGLLSWDFHPLPDGRFDEVKEIAADSQRMAELITGAKILTVEEAAATGIHFSGENKRLHLRIRTLPDGDHFALIINENLERSESARLTVRDDLRFNVSDVLAARDRGVLDAKRNMAITVPAGGAVC